MAAPTDAQLLENVKTAINTILTGAQSYTIAGRQLTRANLKDLFELKKQLEAKIRKASSNPGTVAHARFGLPEGTSNDWTDRPC